MSEQTKIAWCDSTINFWTICTEASLGCANCYAKELAKRFGWGGGKWGKGVVRHKFTNAVAQAHSLNRKPWICDECGEAYAETTVDHCAACDTQTTFHRRRIFSLSLGDWLDDEVPIDWLAEMLDTIRQCDQVTWILCTKRPENWRKRMDEILHWQMATGDGQHDESFFEWVETWTDCLDMPERGDFPQNIILLASVENQPAADKRIPELLKIPAACYGLSLEPLLDKVKLHDALQIWEHEGRPCCVGKTGWHKLGEGMPSAPKPKIDWLIIGGESGNNARPCDVDWIRSLVQQGQAAGVATFVKQMGQWLADGMRRCGHDVKDKKGGDPAEWPADLRVQEWPKGF